MSFIVAVFDGTFIIIPKNPELESVIRDESISIGRSVLAVIVAAPLTVVPLVPGALFIVGAEVACLLNQQEAVGPDKLLDIPIAGFVEALFPLHEP